MLFFSNDLCGETHQDQLDRVREELTLSEMELTEAKVEEKRRSVSRTVVLSILQTIFGGQLDGILVGPFLSKA
jgi:hypothetical protein